MRRRIPTLATLNELFLRRKGGFVLFGVRFWGSFLAIFGHFWHVSRHVATCRDQKSVNAACKTMSPDMHLNGELFTISMTPLVIQISCDYEVGARFSLFCARDTPKTPKNRPKTPPFAPSPARSAHGTDSEQVTTGVNGSVRNAPTR